MTIGIDLSSLQGAHRMRGIGYTLINFINHIPEEQRKRHKFIFFYELDAGGDDPLDLLVLDDMDYEVRDLEVPKRITQSLPGKLHLAIRFSNMLIGLRDLHRGDGRIINTDSIEVFLQTDQMVSLPQGTFKKAFIAYDLIPYVLEWDYLWNFKTAKKHGLPLQAALRCSGRRWLYIHKLRVNSRRANKIFSISNATSSDWVRYIPSSKNKVETIPLGVSPVKNFNLSHPTQLHRYVESSWGYLKKPFKFEASSKYLLFVGGADKRRKLQELVIAFNHLKGSGSDIKLVLAGDSMQGPRNIATEDIQQSLQHSSYLDDIIFMGFVSDEQRDWLYKHAVAFVFPSVYEGFGLPVLEALAYGTNVISYPNAATLEVAHDSVITVEGFQGIIDGVNKILHTPNKSVPDSQYYLKRYSWQKTSKAIVIALEGLVV